MANHSPTPEDVDAFVKQVIGLSKTLNAYADAAVALAQEQYDAGEIGFSDFNVVLQSKLAVTQKCFEMTNNASAVLFKIAANELAPLQSAADRLQAAADKLDESSRGVQIMSDLVVAAAAISVAVVTPSPASIGAAGGAIVKLTTQIVATAAPAR
jgi:hypothetical protein